MNKLALFALMICLGTNAFSKERIYVFTDLDPRGNFVAGDVCGLLQNEAGQAQFNKAHFNDPKKHHGVAGSDVESTASNWLWYFDSVLGIIKHLEQDQGFSPQKDPTLTADLTLEESVSESRGVKPEITIQALSHRYPEISDRLDHLLWKAQMKYPDCPILVDHADVDAQRNDPKFDFSHAAPVESMSASQTPLNTVRGENLWAKPYLDGGPYRVRSAPAIH